MAEANDPPVADILEPDDQPADDSGVDEVCLCFYILNQTKLVTGHRQRFLDPIDIFQYIPISSREW
jgi:hypothetical protein